jgi:broad specificity phosphatase PhoE
MKIYLARHGQTTGDVEDRYGGSYDDSLTIDGVKQANDLADKLKDKNIKTIYCSPKKRVIETFDEILKKTKANFYIIENLKERNQYGIISGLTKTEALEKFPEEVEKLQQHPYNNFVTNSESYKKFSNRIKYSFNNLVNETEEDFLIITHSGPIRVLFREFFNWGEFKKIGDCALIEIDYNSKEFKLISMCEAELL